MKRVFIIHILHSANVLFIMKIFNLFMYSIQNYFIAYIRAVFYISSR
jgi:hypothetical protein